MIILRWLRLVETDIKEPMQRSTHIIHKTSTQTPTPPNRNGVPPWLSRSLDDLSKQQNFTLYVSRLLKQSVCVIAESTNTHLTSCLQPLYIGHMDTVKALESQRTVRHWQEHVYNQTHECSVYYTSHHAATTRVNCSLLTSTDRDGEVPYCCIACIGHAGELGMAI